jgi:hypothetical protein
MPKSRAPQTEHPQQYLDCLAAFQSMSRRGLSDKEGDAAVHVFYRAIDQYVALAPSIAPMQRLGALNAIWRLDAWQGDSRLGQTSRSEKIELAISQTIEHITGVAADQAAELGVRYA